MQQQHHHASTMHACRICLDYHRHSHEGRASSMRACLICLRYWQHRFAMAERAAPLVRDATEYEHA